MGLNASDTPKLLDQDSPTAALPGHTLYLEIDLEVNPMDGQPVAPMTAVYVPDTKKPLTGNVDILLWFHGDKRVWSRNRKGTLNMSGKSVQDYLKVNECKLREFILQSSKRNFVLVVPTFGDRAGYGPKKTAGGLLWQQADAEAYLQQALNGVKQHLGLSVTNPGTVVLAAHSGGGHLLSRMAQFFTGGVFDRVNEVWCFDCTYWGSEPFLTWAKRGHSHPRLWVYSTGGSGPQATGDYANAILDFSKTKTAPATGIEVLIDNYPASGKTSSTNNFIATYHGSANGHYESIEKYLAQLIDTSQNLG
jgi:hypothetical protein